MKVKCGRAEYDLNKDDEIMYNGACYQIITRLAKDCSSPTIAKKRAKDMIKSGKLVLKEKRKMHYNYTVDIYKTDGELEG